jgi:hypothetical protein
MQASMILVESEDTVLKRLGMRLCGASGQAGQHTQHTHTQHQTKHICSASEANMSNKIQYNTTLHTHAHRNTTKHNMNTNTHIHTHTRTHTHTHTHSTTQQTRITRHDKHAQRIECTGQNTNPSTIISVTRATHKPLKHPQRCKSTHSLLRSSTSRHAAQSKIAI